MAVSKMLTPYHSANIVVTDSLFAPDKPIATFQRCQQWYMFVAVVGELMLASLEVTIIHRSKHTITLFSSSPNNYCNLVYAMYQQDKRILAILCVLVIVEVLIVCIAPAQYFSRLEIIGPACLVDHVAPLKLLVIP
jgi:uncharacterized membrane protein